MIESYTSSTVYLHKRASANSGTTKGSPHIFSVMKSWVIAKARFFSAPYIADRCIIAVKSRIGSSRIKRDEDGSKGRSTLEPMVRKQVLMKQTNSARNVYQIVASVCQGNRYSTVNFERDSKADPACTEMIIHTINRSQ